MRPLGFNNQHLFELVSWTRNRLGSQIPISCFKNNHFWFKVLDNERMTEIPPNFPQSNDSFLITFLFIYQVLSSLVWLFSDWKQQPRHLHQQNFLEYHKNVEPQWLQSWPVTAVFLIEEMPTISPFCFVLSLLILYPWKELYPQLFFSQSNYNLAICLYLLSIRFWAGACEMHSKGLNKDTYWFSFALQRHYSLRSHSHMSKSQLPCIEDTA